MYNFLQRYHQRLSVLPNYFNDLKQNCFQYVALYVAKFLNILSKLFLSYTDEAEKNHSSE